jgi:hypothetical protein
MALSNTEIQTVKNLMGYSNMTTLALPYIDVALVFETVVQNDLDAYGEGYIRATILPNLAQLDLDIMSARSRYKADELVGEIKLNKQEHERLLTLREYWLDRLAETIRIPRAGKVGRASQMDIY